MADICHPQQTGIAWHGWTKKVSCTYQLTSTTQNMEVLLKQLALSPHKLCCFCVGEALKSPLPPWTSSRKDFNSSDGWLSSCDVRLRSHACECPSALMISKSTVRPTLRRTTSSEASPSLARTPSRKRVAAAFYSTCMDSSLKQSKKSVCAMRVTLVI